MDDAMEEAALVPPWKTCVVLSMSYFFIYTAFESIQNLQSSLNHEDGLGVASLAITYSSMMIGTFIGPVSVRAVGPKNLILVGFFFHLLYILANFRPSYATLVPSSILLGFGISGLAMSMGLYLTASSKSFLFYSALSTSRLHGVLSMFNGFFYSCFTGTHISGNFISSMILFSSSYNETILEDNVCGAAVCAASGNATVIDDPDQKVVFTLLGVFAAFNLTGTVLTALCLPRLHVAAYQTDSPKHQNVCANLSGCCKKFISWKFVILAPLFTAQAMAVMTMYTGYTKVSESCVGCLQDK
ncbi:unnamed protein product [Lymnaea stagnalis]|uniref:Uncharacterized protein n=1 Tax=Lymnaea stagnalis TaxID=6523 RepID=A0AAV2H6U8_LYMST